MADTEQWIRNRALMAERGKWPAGALDVVASIEDMFPDYAAYWSPSEHSRSGEGFYAMRRKEDNTRNLLFGAQADDLIASIQADLVRVQAEHEKWLKTWGKS